MKAKYRKFSEEYIEHLALLPQNRHLRKYQKWVRKQRKQTKQEKQICHVAFNPKGKQRKLYESFVKSCREDNK